jgi:RNA polymerase sigma factor (sigma-70 family)
MPGDHFRDLVRRAQARDAAAIEQLLEIVRPSLEKLADRFIDRGHPSWSAAELVQDAWVMAWQRLDQFHGTDQDDEQMLAMFQAWVSRIVISLGLNSVRARQARGRRPTGKLMRLDSPPPAQSDASEGRLELPADIPSPSANARTNERDRLIEEALRRCLTPDQRKIIQLVFFEGLTLGEVAKRLDLTYDQVRERHRTAIHRLERELGPLR